MEDVICIACGKNCTLERIESILTEDGPVCILCLGHEVQEEIESQPGENDWEEPYDY